MQPRHLGVLAWTLASAFGLALGPAGCAGSDTTSNPEADTTPDAPQPTGSSTSPAPGGSTSGGAAVDAAVAADAGPSDAATPGHAAANIATASCKAPVPSSGARGRLSVVVWAGRGERRAAPAERRLPVRPHARPHVTSA